METEADTEADGGGVVRKLVVPATIGAAAGAAGLVLTRKKEAREAVPKLRDAVSDLPLPNVKEGAGDLAGDLRNKLDDVLGKEPSGDEPMPVPHRIDPKFERRRRERQQRRERRRRSRS